MRRQNPSCLISKNRRPSALAHRRGYNAKKPWHACAVPTKNISPTSKVIGAAGRLRAAYLSYLPEQKEWAKKLVHDLQDAGVYIVEKPEDLKAEDFAIVLDTSAYRKAFQA